MRKIKMFYILLVVVTALTTLRGCGESGTGRDACVQEQAAEESISGAASIEKMITLKAASTISEESYAYKALETFKRQVETQSDGSIQIQLYPANQLGGVNEIIKGIELGTVELGLIQFGSMSAFYPDLDAICYLFAFEDEQHAYTVYTSEIGQNIMDVMAEKINVRALGYSFEGVRDIWTAKPVKDISDLQGLKLRVPEVPSLIADFTAIGSYPIPMSISEVYTALSVGIIEGLEMDASTVLNENLYDSCKYCLESNHAITIMGLCIAEDIYESLDDAQKSIIDRASADCHEKMTEAYFAAKLADKQTLQRLGVTFTSMDSTLKAQIISKVSPVIDDNLERLGCGKNWRDDIAALAQK